MPLLVLDEAHRSLGEETVKVLEQFSGIKIGFTATDVFSREKKVGDVLEECIHTMSLREAIQEGALVTTQTIHAFTEVDLSSVPMAGDEYNQAMLERSINVAGRNKAAIELYQKAFVGRKAICYCSGINHAETLAKEFLKVGISAAVITSNTPEESRNGVIGRKEILAKYKSGEIMVLCNAKVLVEGFDEDSCSVGFNLHPTRSLVDAEQRGGRPGRLDPNNPNKISTVVDFIDKNAKKKPILFSEILGGAYVLRPKGREKLGNLLDEVVSSEDVLDNKGTQEIELVERDSTILKLISIEGLRVSVDPQEVMTVTNEYAKSREKKEFDFEKLKQEVHVLGVNSSGQYQKIAPEQGWPSTTTLTSKSEWKGWDDFLAREVKKQLTFKELQAEVKVAKFTSSGQYAKIAPERGWPSPETLKSRPEWKGWDDFLGRESLSIEKLKQEVHATGVKTSEKYKKIAPEQGWPSITTLTNRPEWNGWDNFLGREAKKELTFEALQNEVRSAGVKSSKEYQKKSSERGWLHSKTLTSKSEWNGWDDFLGRS